MMKLTKLCKRAHVKPAVILPLLAVIGLLTLLTVWYAGPSTVAAAAGAGQVQVAAERRLITSKIFGRIRCTELPVSPAETEELVGILAETDEAAQSILAAGFGGERLQEVIVATEEELEGYIARHPASGWSLALRKEIALRYQNAGRISRAMTYWSEAWDGASQAEGVQNKVVADYALAYGTRLMASLGRLEDLLPIAIAHQNRIFSEPHLAQMWVRTREAIGGMRRTPGIAYRCGTYALNNVATQLRGHGFGGILSVPSGTNGFTLAELSALSDAHDLGLVAAVRSPDADFLIPAVVHWKQNHYAAILAEENGRFLIKDPTFGKPKWIDSDVLEEESSGFFMVPLGLGLPNGWRRATAKEMLAVYGKGYFQDMPDEEPPGCTPGSVGGGGGCCPPEEGPDGTGGDGPPCGMPFWNVIEPNINLDVSDIPMKYDSAIGPDFVLRLNWRQRNDRLLSGRSHFSEGWECGLLSYVNYGQAPRYGLISSPITLYSGDGFSYTMNFSGSSTVSDQNENAGTWAVRTPDVNGNVVKIEVYYRNGAKDTHEYFGTSFRLTARADATGQAMTFSYDQPDGTTDRLTRVTMADGAEFNFNYTTGGADDYAIQSVTGPGSPARSVSFGYTSGKLTGITDAVGIVSSLAYDPVTQWITDITTPYGTTSFNHWDSGGCGLAPLGCDGVDRSVVITEPAGTHQVYLFYDNPYRSGVHNISNGMAGKIPTAFTSGQIPGDAYGDQPTIQTLDVIRDERNSHYWNRQQAAQISPSLLTNLTALTNTEYLVSRTRHWLQEYGSIKNVRVLSWELPPSADGMNESQPVFYDYEGKDPNWTSAEGDYTTYTGTSDAPKIVAQQMLDGTMRYDEFERNALGMKTRHIERWVENGAAVTRENQFTYATGTGLPHVDNLLKVKHVGPGGKIVFGRALHGTYADQIGRETNAVGEVTVFNYDSYSRLTTKQTHAGLLSTYTYDGTSHRLLTIVDSISGTALRTHSYTWQNGYERTHTDPRGFTRTFDYDYLGRILTTTYPDSTTETYEYSLPGTNTFNTSGTSLPILDLVTYKDRMGNKTRTLPNRNRQIEIVVEPPKTTNATYGTAHTIDYCGCGSPTRLIRGSNTGGAETNHFTYDYRGNLTRLELPNGTTTTNWYDVLGRLWLQQDGLSQTTNLYDNLNRVIQRSNGAGIIEGFAYDADNRITTSTNSSGVVVTHVYDNLDRILTRTYPSGGVEKWYYSPGYPEATIYTNQLGNLTTWAYDPALRRTNEVGVGIYTNIFTYSPANDLVVLLDGRTNRTMWLYDAEGRLQVKTNQSNAKVLTNSYNANSQLTVRWTPAKGLTDYAYDAVGNLTNVNYPAGTTDIKLVYNDLNRLTSMQDGSGTTAFTYNTVGDLLTENGPFSDDTVTYKYHLSVPHLRTNLTLTQPSGTWSQTYLHDPAKRISSITSPAGTFAYTYSTGVAGATNASQLWKKLALFTGSSAYITNIFDSSARLTNTTLFNSSNSELNKHDYLYNLANQRTNQVRTGGGYVNYTYDPIGQLQSAQGFLSGGATDTTDTKGYKYDAGQNLNVRTNNGSTTTFSVNVRNELTGSYTYDSNGNLTGDSNGRTYTYDAENRLVQITGTSNSFRYDFTYDGFGRLRMKSTYVWSGGIWTFQSAIRYIYDGWTVIQERDYGGTPTVSYTRGTDLSGTLQGAGGIGGLLARSSGYSSGTWSTHHAYHADGGGNITAMVNTSQALSANYRYDAFGNLISSSGGFASANTYRFSSKEWMPDADLYYYGYRFYSPNYQRWINQDPIGEEGGINLYKAFRNSPIIRIDPWGLSDECLKPGPYGKESIPASSTGYSAQEKDKITELGKKNGCHTCGTKKPGTSDGRYIPDHQPPTKLNPEAKPQQLYPHCKSCSQKQGGQVTAAKTRSTGVGRAASGAALATAGAAAASVNAMAENGSFQNVVQQAKNGASKAQIDDAMFEAACEAAIDTGEAGALHGTYGPWWWFK